MSKEYTNYQTLVQSKQRIMQEFENKKQALMVRNSNNEALMGSFEGTAASTYKSASDELLNAINEAESQASAKLDRDIEKWFSQLNEAEKQSALEFKEKIGL